MSFLKLCAVIFGAAINCKLAICQEEKNATLNLEISLKEVTSTSLVVKWQEVPNFSQYGVVVDYKFKDINDCVGKVPGNSPFTILETRGNIPLSARTAYHVAVCATDDNNGNESLSASASFRTGPLPPSLFRIEQTTTRNLELSWKDWCKNNVCHPSRNTTYYDLFYHVNGESNEQSVRRITNQFAKIDNLIPSTRYIIKIRIVVENSRIMIRSDDARLFAETVPSNVRNSSRCQVEFKTEEICISWLKPEGGNAIEGYEVVWNIPDISVRGRRFVIYSGEERQNYTIQDLQPGYAVNVEVSARNSAARGGALVRTLETTPSATMPPTTCEVNEIKIDKTTQICIIWPKPPGGDVINNYYVQWTIDGSFTFSSTVNFNQNNFGIYVITNLSPGIIVTIIIYANNGGGNGDPSPPTDIPTYPAIPQNIHFVPTETTITVFWEKPKGHADYVVIEVLTIFLEVRLNVSEVNYEITDLTADTLYIITLYSIFIVPPDGRELNSEKVSHRVKTLPEISFTEPAIPQNIHFVSTETTIVVFWEEPEGLADYVVIEVPAISQKVRLNISGVNYEITNLTADTLYTITLYSTLKVPTGQELNSEKESHQVKTLPEISFTGATSYEFLAIILGSIAALLLILMALAYHFHQKQRKRIYEIQASVIDVNQLQQESEESVYSS